MILNGLEAMGELSGRERALAIRTAHAGPAAVLVAVEDSGGMGLAIARIIVHAHGGQICASNNPTGGATFALTLPASGEPSR